MSDESLTRQERIVDWLSRTPDLGIPMRSGAGFYVNRGAMIRLKNGQEVEAIEWLEKEGFHNGTVIGGYSLKHAPASEQFSEKLSFFKVTTMTDAPF